MFTNPRELKFSEYTGKAARAAADSAMAPDQAAAAASAAALSALRSLYKSIAGAVADEALVIEQVGLGRSKGGM
jgi:hypothetical protein